MQFINNNLLNILRLQKSEFMDWIYQKHNPRAHKNLKSEFRQIDKIFVFSVFRHMNKSEFITNFTPTESILQEFIHIFNEMIRLRNFVRFNLQQGKNMFDSVFDKLVLIFCLSVETKSDFAKAIVDFITSSDSASDFCNFLTYKECFLNNAKLTFQFITMLFEKKIGDNFDHPLIIALSTIEHFDDIAYLVRLLQSKDNDDFFHSFFRCRIFKLFNIHDNFQTSSKSFFI